MQLTVEQLEYMNPKGDIDDVAHYQYKIVEIVGTTRFFIGDIISKEELDSHMSSGMTVIIR